MGYTPQLVTAVWVGYGQTEKSMDDVHGIRVYGGTFPAEIWSHFMDSALSGLPVADFPSAPAPDYVWLDGWQKPYVPPPPGSGTHKRGSGSGSGTTGTGDTGTGSGNNGSGSGSDGSGNATGTP